jgi:hypothetical protein
MPRKREEIEYHPTFILYFFFEVSFVISLTNPTIIRIQIIGSMSTIAPIQIANTNIPNNNAMINKQTIFITPFIIACVNLANIK